MNVNDYVRTKWGVICKIININELREPELKYGVELNLADIKFIGDEDILKSSPNIKSVIEENDFVNGEKITRVIPEDICGDEILDYQHIFIGDKEIYEEDIKSIVTKEQFERMEYKI